MSGLSAKLQQLRAQSGRSAASPTPKATLSADVLRILHGRSRIQGRIQRENSSDRFVPGNEIAPGVFLAETIMEGEKPEAMIDTRFARWEEPVAHQRLLHFDTETTGLAGGTGTRAWMIGAADWMEDGRMRVRQLTITTMAAETAMLRTFASWLSPDTVMVSYNGKSYDSPLLKTRYRLARLPDPITGLGHLDLLHPTRRHWKGMWENCRLATVERELLGVVREDDLPGSEAPAAWLNYLRGGSALNVRRVLAHNQQDLVSLSGVLLRLSRMLP